GHGFSAAQRIEIERPSVNAALVVDGEVVQTHERLAFPLHEQVAALPRGFIEQDQPAAGAYDSSALIEHHAANPLALGDDGIDRAVRIAPINAAVGDVAEIEAALLIDTRRFEQAIAAAKSLEFHRRILLPPVYHGASAWARTASDDNR